uniref:Uncharacterized protein n=1 Tax=Arundo donax TaxID=35708 RepID=A0A0A9FW30_ARUDO
MQNRHCQKYRPKNRTIKGLQSKIPKQLTVQQPSMKVHASVICYNNNACSRGT